MQMVVVALPVVVAIAVVFSVSLKHKWWRWWWGLVTRLWKECFFHLSQFAHLGSGNVLAHCEHGYHRGPVGGGLVWCSLHNSAPSCDTPANMLWFLDELAKVQANEHTQRNTNKNKRTTF